MHSRRQCPPTSRQLRLCDAAELCIWTYIETVPSSKISTLSGSSLAAATRHVVPAATAWLGLLDLDEGAMILSLPGS